MWNALFSNVISKEIKRALRKMCSNSKIIIENSFKLKSNENLNQMRQNTFLINLLLIFLEYLEDVNIHLQSFHKFSYI